MSSRRKRRAPRVATTQEVNQRCKMFLVRQCIIWTLALSTMTYFLSYEQPNVTLRPRLLNESDLVVMSYNVRASNLDTGTTTKWQSRKKVAVEMLNLYQPDIIGVQEPQIDQIETFKQNGYHSYGKYTATSILYNKHKFKMIDSDTLWLSETPHIEHSTSWDMSQQRVLTWILITNLNTQQQCQSDDDDDDMQQCQIKPIKQQSYLVFNTHLDHIGEKSRYESCIVIKNIIHEISMVKYENKYPVFITGDFNAAKYGHVWKCFMDNDDDSFELSDALHDSFIFSYRKKLQLQYTFHDFRGLQMNKWYMRAAQYIFFGCSNSLVKYFRNYFHGVCCMAPSLYRQIYRRREYNRKAGIHHVDWILYDKHKTVDKVNYFEVISYHHIIDVKQQKPIKWSLTGLFRERVVDKTVYPSDHFPVIAGFKLK